MLQGGAEDCKSSEAMLHAGFNFQAPHQNLILAHRIMIERYVTIIEKTRPLDMKFLLNFCSKAFELENSDKLSRWVGFIQGILYSKGIINIADEREFSRKLYKPIYDEMGFDSKTIEV